MLFEKIRNVDKKYLFQVVLTLVALIVGLFFIISSINAVSKSNQEIFAYTVKVRDTVEDIDKVFERAEVNVNVMVDSIANSYELKNRNNKAYNLHFVENINGLVKSVLSNSPSVDGSWFQLNADLPYSAEAYNWFEFRDNQFVNVKDQFEDTTSVDRKITPENDPYYFDAVANQKPVWSDVYTDADTNRPMITISAPIYKEDSLVGVVGIDVSTDNLQLILGDMQSVLGDSELYLLGDKNNIILSQLVGDTKLTKDKNFFSTIFSGSQGGPIEYYDGLTKKTAIILKLSNGYKIVISIANKTLFSETNQIINMNYILFILLIISIAIGITNKFKSIKVDDSQIIEEEHDSDEEQE